MPTRIQRKRTKGWKMPANTVYVGRPGEWGNPFQVGDFVRVGDGKTSAFAYLKTNRQYATASYTEIKTIEEAVELYRKYLTNYPPHDIGGLKGKNLACWCKKGEPCHADILLEIANG